jgi:hypothetical protein
LHHHKVGLFTWSREALVSFFILSFVLSFLPFPFRKKSCLTDFFLFPLFFFLFTRCDEVVTWSREAPTFFFLLSPVSFSKKVRPDRKKFRMLFDFFRGGCGLLLFGFGQNQLPFFSLPTLSDYSMPCGLRWSFFIQYVGSINTLLE